MAPAAAGDGDQGRQRDRGGVPGQVVGQGVIRGAADEQAVAPVVAVHADPGPLVVARAFRAQAAGVSLPRRRG